MKKWVCVALAAALMLLGTGCTLADSVARTVQRFVRDRSTASETETPEDGTQTVLAETEDFVFSVQSAADENGIFIVTTRVENKTQDTSLRFVLEDVYVDSMLCWPSFFAEPSPGETAVYEAFFSGLDALGVEEATQLEFTLRVSDSENWDRPALYSESITYFPQGEAAAVRHQPPRGSRETVLFDNEVCKMTVVDFDPLDKYMYSVTPYVENRSDKKLRFRVENVKIDGKPANPYWSVALMPQKDAAEKMYWPLEMLDEIGIAHPADISEITFQVIVHEEGEEDVVFKDKITLHL